MEMTMEQMMAEIQRMKAENAKLKSQASTEAGSKLTYRISEKGAVCVYQLGRFPVTLYYDQWMKLLDENNVAELKAYLEKNKANLSLKDRSKSNGTNSVENSHNNVAKGVVESQNESKPQTISQVVVGDEVPFTA